MAAAAAAAAAPNGDVMAVVAAVVAVVAATETPSGCCRALIAGVRVERAQSWRCSVTAGCSLYAPTELPYTMGYVW